SYVHVCLFFFSSRRRHTRFSRDWSSDVCSSDLYRYLSLLPPGRQEPQEGFLDGVLRERAANNGNFISPAITPARVQLRARRIGRSEERRVGKECRGRWTTEH